MTLNPLSNCIISSHEDQILTFRSFCALYPIVGPVIILASSSSRLCHWKKCWVSGDTLLGRSQVSA